MPGLKVPRIGPTRMTPAPDASAGETSFLPDQAPVLDNVPTVAGPTPISGEPAAQDTNSDVDLPDKKSPLEDVYGSVAGMDPERAAKVISLSRRLEQPEAFIDKNLDAVHSVVNAPTGGFFKQLEDQYPGTTKFLTDPRNMAATKDDLPNVAEHEGLVQKITNTWESGKQAFESGSLQEELAFLRYAQIQGGQVGGYDPFRLGAGVAGMDGITSTDPETRANQISGRLDELSKGRPAEGFLKKGAYGAAEFLPQIIGGLGYGAKYAIPAAGTAALATSMAGPLAGLTATGAGAAGFTAGEAEYNYKLMTGMSYEQLLKVRDQNGQPLPENVSKLAAIGMGAATAGLSFIKLNALMDTIPGGKDFLARFSASAGEKVLESSSTMGTALKSFVNNYVHAVSHGVVAMTGITAVNQAGVALAKDAAEASGDHKFDDPAPSETYGEFATAAIDAAGTFGILSLPGTTGALWRDVHQASRAVQAKEFMTSLGSSAEASKLRERMPEAHRALVEQITHGTPVENVYLPVKAAEEYFQSKGLPPDRIMEELGVGDSYREAKSTGGDVRVPLATWTDKVVGTEHFQGLANDVKFHPEDLTISQVEERKAEITKAVKEIEARAQTEANASPLTPEDSASKIGTALEEQLKAAGVSATEARIDPKLHEAFFRTLGQTLGVDPYALAQRFPLSVQRGEHRPVDAGTLQPTDGGVELHQKNIDLSESARKDRAQKLGFNTDKVFYHGMKSPMDGVGFDPSKVKQGGAFFFSENPAFANKFASGKFNDKSLEYDPAGANVLPVYLKTSKSFDYGNTKQVDRLLKAISKKAMSEIGRALNINGRPMSSAEFRQQIEFGNFNFMEHPKVIEAIKKAGFDSYFVSENGTKNIAVFDPSQIRSVNAEFDTGKSDSPNILHHGPNETPRGRIRFGTQGSLRLFNIDLLKNADRSTFLHESGHYFLEVMGDIASKEGAPEDVKADYQTILNWMGVDSREQVKTEQHEQFARGFEAYLMEGNAPTPALRKAFHRFRDWLVSLYRNVQNLNVTLTDDVRGVMDRMLATKSEIDAARRRVSYEPIVDLPGLTPEIAARIRDLQDTAREQAESVLMKEQMKELTAKRAEFLNSERERLTESAKEEIGRQPLYAAIEELNTQSGKGAKTATSRAQRFLKALEKGEGAEAEFETLAEIHGFSSGEDLARNVVDAAANESFRKAVKEKVDAGMAQHADLKDTGALRIEAIKAIHSEKMTELLALEREALAGLVHDASVRQEVSRRNKVVAAIEAKAAKDSAREILSKKPIKDSTSPRAYITSERNAAVRVAKALAEKDYSAAAVAKREQMLSHALVAEAMRNKTEADKAFSFLSQYGKRGADFMNMPYGFIRQIDAMLGRNGLAENRVEASDTLMKVAQTMLERGSDPADIANSTGFRLDENGRWTQETLADFSERVNSNYYAMTLPDSAMSLQTRDSKTMTIQDLRDIKEAVKAVAHVGKSLDRYFGEYTTMDIRKAAADFKASVADNFGTPYAADLKAGSQHESKLAEALSMLSKLPGAFDRQLDTILTTCHKFDGLKEGPAKDNIYRPFELAEGRKTARTAKVMKEIDAIFAAHYGVDELAAYKDTRIKIDDRYFGKDEILSMALNWGNEGNRDRLMRGFGFDEAKMSQIFQHLGKKDWDFAQATWKHLNQYWPDIVKLEMEVSGSEPKSVTPLAFENQHGKYEGGYYPIAYDFEKSVDAYQNNQQKDALYKQYSTSKAHTEQGHTEARSANVTRPLRLSLDVLKSHHEDVIHDLEMRRAVIDVSRFLAQKDTKQALLEAVGVKGYAAINDWLKSAAGGGGEPLTFFDRAAQWFRFKTTFFNLGYRIISAPKIGIENLINVSSEVGVSGAARSLKEYYLGESGMHELIVGKSEFMRMRAEHLNRDISDIHKKWEGKDQGPFHKFAFFVHAYIDQGVSFPLWADAYKRAMADHGKESLAVTQADETVKRTFMGGGRIDQSAIMGGSEKQKALTTAYGYQSMMWNRFSQQRFQVGSEWAQGNHTTAAAIAARATVYTFLMPALTAALTREFLRNVAFTNEEDRKKRIAATLIEEGTPLKFVPILRDIAPYLIKKALGERASGIQVTPLEEAAQTLIGPVGEGLHALSSGHVSDRFPEETANALSLLVGVPKQFNDITFNFIDWQKNNGALTWRDFMSRKAKK